MSERFKWRAINDAKPEMTISETTAQFGDGYAQVVAKGINPVSERWPVTFRGSREEVLEIDAFFRRNAGRPFQWLTPLGFDGWFKTRSFSPAWQGGAEWTISATFEQFHKT